MIVSLTKQLFVDHKLVPMSVVLAQVYVVGVLCEIHIRDPLLEFTASAAAGQNRPGISDLDVESQLTCARRL